MIDIKGAGYQGAMLVFQMVDEIAKEFGYINGAQDLIGEEPCINVEILQLVQERLIAQAEMRRVAALEALRIAEEEVARAYQ